MPREKAEPTERQIVQRIHEAYPDLPEGERKVAEAILAAPVDLAVLNAGEIAAGAHVSNATVTRFFRRLGYASFEEARRDARRLRAVGSPLISVRGARPKGDSISRLIREETVMIEASLSRINPLTIQDIAQALVRAPRIRTVGFRNSHFLAQYITAQFAQMRPGVDPLFLPGQTLSEGVMSLATDDLVIVIGLRRRPAAFNRVVETIAKRGSDILLLADDTIRVAPAFARWTLDCVVDTPQFADSYVGAVAILRLLAIEVNAALGTDGHRHLQEVEDLRDWLDELE